MGWTIAIIGGIILLILIFGVVSYNRFVSQRQLIKDAWSNVDTELKRRLRAHPQSRRDGEGLRRATRRRTFDRVTQARNRAPRRCTARRRSRPRQRRTRSRDGGEVSLLVIAEAYPS